MESKGLGLVILAGLVLVIFCACISLEARQIASEERGNLQVLGTVTAKWISLQFFHIPPSEKTIENKAIAELKAAAQKQGYTGNIDIRNISVAGTFNPLTLMPVFPHAGAFGNFQTVVASGDVVEYGTQGRLSIDIQRKIANAVTNATLIFVDRLSNNSTIAVLSVFSSDNNTSEYIIGELEYNLVNSGKFKIVDRRQLNQIRMEQNFQLSGEVSDTSAVSIGNMLGASIVITGEITGTGSNQRLVLKALDVRTAQIIAMARELL
jgi:hypothetical protein